jgi:glycosyltransferase involved in cell wall biosynthesis
MNTPKINVIIPAFNEATAVGNVIAEIPAFVSEIIVVNNNSTDTTATVAQQAGATVLHEPRQGYGFACLKGMEYLAEAKQKTDIVVFLDADYSDFPEEMSDLLRPILEENIDFVVGSRALGNKERGSMTPQQIFGNWLSTTLIRWFYGVRYTDLGPFRAIKFDKLIALKMQDKTYGWTVEMQLKAAKMKYSIQEIPVNYRQRIGESKVSGTIKGTIMAGYKILGWIFTYAFR